MPKGEFYTIDIKLKDEEDSIELPFYSLRNVDKYITRYPNQNIMLKAVGRQLKKSLEDAKEYSRESLERYEKAAERLIDGDTAEVRILDYSAPGEPRRITPIFYANCRDVLNERKNTLDFNRHLDDKELSGDFLSMLMEQSGETFEDLGLSISIGKEDSEGNVSGEFNFSSSLSSYHISRIKYACLGKRKVRLLYQAYQDIATVLSATDVIDGETAELLESFLGKITTTQKICEIVTTEPIRDGNEVSSIELNIPVIVKQ